MASKSTGKADLAEAREAAEHMVTNQGSRPTIHDAQLSDDEFEAIQRAHFERKLDPDARSRSPSTGCRVLPAVA